MRCKIIVYNAITLAQVNLLYRISPFNTVTPTLLSFLQNYSCRKKPPGDSTGGEREQNYSWWRNTGSQNNRGCYRCAQVAIIHFCFSVSYLGIEVTLVSTWFWFLQAINDVKISHCIIVPCLCPARDLRTWNTTRSGGWKQHSPPMRRPTCLALRRRTPIWGCRSWSNSWKRSGWRHRRTPSTNVLPPTTQSEVTALLHNFIWKLSAFTLRRLPSKTVLFKTKCCWWEPRHHHQPQKWSLQCRSLNYSEEKLSSLQQGCNWL